MNSIGTSGWKLLHRFISYPPCKTTINQWSETVRSQNWRSMPDFPPPILTSLRTEINTHYCLFEDVSKEGLPLLNLLTNMITVLIHLNTISYDSYTGVVLILKSTTSFSGIYGKLSSQGDFRFQGD